MPEGTVFCPSCRKIQPVGRNEDPFSLLGLPREFELDARELERRFRELSRQLHPDRFARAEPRERRLSLERATRLNDALRALRPDLKVILTSGYNPDAQEDDYTKPKDNALFLPKPFSRDLLLAKVAALLAAA